MAPELKLSKAQYQALLDRNMSRTPVASQQSALGQMQGAMGGSPMPMPQAPQPQMPMAPQAPSMGPIGAPDPMAQAISGTMQPTRAPAAQDLVGSIQMAEQAWMKLKGSVGEQLWTRLAANSPDTQGLRPDTSFVQTLVKYQRDPNSIIDERVKEFIASMTDVQPMIEEDNFGGLAQAILSRQNMGMGPEGGV
jgi:hypothetical protein